MIGSGSSTDDDPPSAAETAPEEASEDLLTALVRGAEGGAVATVTMTIFRIPAFRALPPTAEFWSKRVAGGDPSDHLLPALLLHLAYGMGAGTVLGPIVGALSSQTDRRGHDLAICCGAVYGLVMSALGSRVVLPLTIDERLDEREAAVFHAGHLVYGLSLGTWLGVQKSRADVTEEATESGGTGGVWTGGN